MSKNLIFKFTSEYLPGTKSAGINDVFTVTSPAPKLIGGAELPPPWCWAKDDGKGIISVNIRVKSSNFENIMQYVQNLLIISTFQLLIKENSQNDLDLFVLELT
ncbi:MAG: hypothetical protein ACE5RR_06305 [Nitrosarchaeum sp.]